MNILIRILLSALAVYISAKFLPGITLTGGLWTAIVVAVVLGLLNAFVKPILTILTIPVTILTLGLFLLVINVIIIYIAAALIGGFDVDGFFSALIFSIVVSIVSWILSSIFD